MRKLQRFPSPGEKNALWYWHRTVNPFKVVKNFAVIQLCRYTPSMALKNFFYRHLLGMRVGKNAAVGLMVMIDVFFPELVSIGENSVIGYNSTLLGHEYLIREYRKGAVQIGANVMIGANTTVLPGVEIGDHAVISAGSLVNKDIPPGVYAGGVPVRILGSGVNASGMESPFCE